MSQTSNAINWPWVLRSRADAAYLGDTEGTVKLLQQVADYIEAAIAAGEVSEQHSVEPVAWTTRAVLDDLKTRGYASLIASSEHALKFADSEAVALYTHPPVTAGWEKAQGAIRGLKSLKAAFDMKGANSTTIERAIETLATLSTPPQEPEPGEHQEVLDAIDACNSGEEE